MSDELLIPEVRVFGTSLYASRSGGHLLTLVAINKTDSSHNASVSLDGFRAHSARAFMVSAEDLTHSAEEPASVGAGSVDFELPPESIVSIPVRD